MRENVPTFLLLKYTQAGAAPTGGVAVVDGTKQSDKKYKVVFVLGGPGSGKGTQVLFFFKIPKNENLIYDYSVDN